MRPFLRWTLGATSVLSAIALWLDDKPAKVVAALERRNLASTVEAASASPSSGATEAALPLPTQLDAAAIEAARRDIFVPVEPPAPKPVASPPAPPPPPPPPPTAPAMTWRYLGSMLTPSGGRLVMLARGDTSVTIQAGMRLEEGYVVEAIGSDAVRLVYPPLGTVVEIPIPPPPPSPR